MTSSILSPRETGKFVSSKASNVSIDNTAIELLASYLADTVEQTALQSVGNEKCYFPEFSGLTSSQIINCVFIVDALNFNFWTCANEPRYTVTWNKVTGSGYLGLIQAINRALANGHAMYNPNYYGQLQAEDLKAMFRSDSGIEIPLLSERQSVLHEVSQVLIDKFNSSFTEMLEKAAGDARKLMQLVVENFPCFKDEAVYCGTKVSLYKRAQILTADLDLVFAMKGMPRLQNMDTLTMFADYRVPQVLLYFGVLVYSASLLENVKDNLVFANGSNEEVEIRACSIEAVERLVQSCRQQLQDRGWSKARALSSVSSVQVDYLLWEYRLANAEKLVKIPYHKTRCIFY
ncbi:hypothetical protein HAZT_HAZT006690 [Hyalella azteca]|uniref:Queuosine 5'-phosphate N-glycosylase/hydrolase n=1 Tax=Hyalella azteca TaxID=294128 RepID=A0A6A0H3R6_HYAAZ|nr:queuosine salvage protein [Hyalella azteca]KAA0198254.1 hypothetical protein HAZT_HAZT006690 [Hyalella azteca]